MLIELFITFVRFTCPINENKTFTGWRNGLWHDEEGKKCWCFMTNGYSREDNVSRKAHLCRQDGFQVALRRIQALPFSSTLQLRTEQTNLFISCDSSGTPDQQINQAAH